MSRPYKVKIRESIQETTIKDDSVTSKLDIVPILSPEAQEQVTRTILREHGFEEESNDSTTDSGSSGSSRMCRERNGVNVSINPKTGEIEAKAEQECTVDISEEAEDEEGKGGCPCRVRSKETVIEAMRKRLARKSAGIQQSVQELVTGKLQGELADLGCEMEQVANQVTQRALKRKAQEIGTIKKIHHNDTTGETTIVVEVNS